MTLPGFTAEASLHTQGSTCRALDTLGALSVRTRKPEVTLASRWCVADYFGSASVRTIRDRSGVIPGSCTAKPVP